MFKLNINKELIKDCLSIIFSGIIASALVLAVSVYIIFMWEVLKNG